MMDQWIPTSYLHEAETQGTGGLDKEELKKYKDFYSKNLKIINDAMKQY